MTRCHRTHAGAGFMRLGDDPRLLFQAPAAPPLLTDEDLHRAVRHRLRLDLKQRFKVTSIGILAWATARRCSPARGRVVPQEVV